MIKIQQLILVIETSVGDDALHLVRVGDVRQRIALDDDEVALVL